MKTLLIVILLAWAAPSGAQQAVSLFNGRDLTGWTGAAYEVKDGVIICQGRNLVSKKQYRNYVFEFDFLLPPHGNNGLGIHYPGMGRPASAGMELQILDNSHPKYAKLKDSQYHGSDLQAEGGQARLPQACWKMESPEGHRQRPPGSGRVERHKDHRGQPG